MTAWASAQSRCRRRRVARWPPQQSETEVQNLQTSIGRHSKIPRLQVSVDHTLHVSRGKTFRELERETHRFLLLQRSGGQHVFDGCPRDELHHQKIHVIEGVEVVDGGDVGVIELGEGLRFLAEPLPGFLIPDPPFGQYLQSDVAVQPLVVGTVNHAHASGPYLFENAIAAERATQHGFGLPLPEA